MMKFKHLTLLANIMLWINFLAIIFIGAQFLFISQYIVRYQESYELLTHLEQTPAPAQNIFWQCAVSSIVLIILIFLRHQIHVERRIINLFFIFEFIAALVIFYSVRMNYNGMFLMVFVDFFLTSRELPIRSRLHFWFTTGILLIIIFSLSNYSFIGPIFKMPPLSTYSNFLPNKLASEITLANNFLSSLNLILFIWIAIGYSFYISNREHKIKNELSLMSKTNRELKSYAAVSEKIAQDRERRRIARDIHDTVGHALTGITAGIDAVMVLIDIDPNAAKEQLQKVSIAVKQGLQDIRITLNKIRPDALEHYTLETSLKKMLKEFSDLSHLQINFNYNWGTSEFEKTTEIVIFRVIEESITNALRHGHATEVDINCKLSESNYIIVIQNNGQSAEKIKPGYGITQMKERLAVINGKVKIESYPIFTVTVFIPRKKKF